MYIINITRYTVGGGGGGARDSIFFEVYLLFLSPSLPLSSFARVIDCTMGSDACSIIYSRTRAADKAYESRAVS